MPLINSDWVAFGITLKLALVTTVSLLVLGIPLAWWLSQTQAKLKPLVESVVALPLVLPPTVLGFYLLLLLGNQGPIHFLFGKTLAFSFAGLIIGSIVYSLPFVVQPLHNTFSSVNSLCLESAATLGAGPWDRFWTIVLPQSLSGILTAALLGFTHTIGEFGVVLMIGGNIPGETQVLSIAIYDHVEALENIQAHTLSLMLLFFSLSFLSLIYWANRKHRLRVGWL